MQEMIKLIIGVCILLLGIPIGSLLAHFTKEELKSGQRWFRIIIVTGLIGGTIGLLTGNDILLFSMFFIAIVASQSLRR